MKRKRSKLKQTQGFTYELVSG